jgi:hypothetical protein
MGGAKPWQIAVMIVALLAALGSIFYSCSTMGSPVRQASYATMVDVNTGELFTDKYPEKHPVTYPQKRPGSTTPTLYPVSKKSDGKWRLDGRYLPLIKAAKDLNPVAIQDWKSGEVKVMSDKATKADIFSKT